MLNKKITACFTGHREISYGQEEKISAALDNIIEMLYRNGVIYYGAGGACGFDMLAEKAVLRARERHKDIRLILVLPCKDHDKYWSIENKTEFDMIIKKADKVVYIGEYYRKGCMFERNRRLVNFSGFCIAYLGCVDTIRNVRIASRFFVFQGNFPPAYLRMARKINAERRKSCLQDGR